MAYYSSKNRGPRVGTADVSHWRAPYKDWISLSADPSIPAASPSVPMFSAVVTGHLLYVDPSMESTLRDMIAVPTDSSQDVVFTGDPTLLDFSLSLSTGQLPNPSAWDVATAYSQQGYAVMLANTSNGLLMTATKSAAVVAKFAIAGNLNPNWTAAVLMAGPTIGLAAEQIASNQSIQTPAPASIQSPIKVSPPGVTPKLSLASLTGLVSSFTGPFGVAVLVLGAAGVAYLLFKSKKRRS